ncbi:hypothetical protein BpHYR1_023550 [Brachionus plicatilis]|uniref:Uncharacterized protein n=1 Tax=Brachionus plicatilis TaxID=10195 RepID=A0A3M7PZT8_BRAPC|nr:hypothetical protein BpHYR1_023550 [Brachionus plicatilis]
MSFQQPTQSTGQQIFPAFQGALTFNTSPYEQYSHASLPSNVQFPASNQQFSAHQFPAQTLNWQNQSHGSPQLPAQTMNWSAGSNFSNSQYPTPQLPAQTQNWSAHSQPPTQSGQAQSGDVSSKWASAHQASNSALAQFPSVSQTQSSFPQYPNFQQYSGAGQFGSYGF